ncbi:MAG TPA: hypothetical protein VFP72_23150 [Kineosporiaceae bacterium]|nr:hypothetical protein [Kineosporiaceae bacterium]
MRHRTAAVLVTAAATLATLATVAALTAACSGDTPADPGTSSEQVDDGPDVDIHVTQPVRTVTVTPSTSTLRRVPQAPPKATLKPTTTSPAPKANTTGGTHK